ncbi:GNAT family N-acetyltransferase [Streptacidiphilus sp. EB129]|uniref:GNAT family N-acetyltransferase n=1 Tax=Streptacidiphilus sp. EB129 TaxID=3156262 RepID=UPI0035137011
MLATLLRDNAELRALEPCHAEEFLAHLDRARTHIAPWVGASFVASDLGGARAVLQRYADGLAGDRQRLYGIWLDGTLVGGTMFVGFDAALGSCEIGCWLEPAAEGQGLITQVVRLMIDWAFRVRGLARAEWRTLPDNTRSINVARRLGMSLDGTLRQALPGADGIRRDKQVWSVLAAEWPAQAQPPTGDAGVKAELDRLMSAFLGAFANTGGGRPRVDVIREVFVPQGMIISNAGDEPVVYDLDAFIAPRERMLTDGTLTEFSEWEAGERTEIFGSIAHRFSEYGKSGFLRGEWFEGSGRKTTQFVRTPDGWRMSSMAWDDV